MASRFEAFLRLNRIKLCQHFLLLNDNLTHIALCWLAKDKLQASEDYSKELALT